jgi:hypothetical protein
VAIIAVLRRGEEQRQEHEWNRKDEEWAHRESGHSDLSAIRRSTAAPFFSKKRGAVQPEWNLSALM